MAKKPRNETTSARVASVAARGLKKPGSLTNKEIKMVSGAALTQKTGKK
jgi:hypothetical protein